MTVKKKRRCSLMRSMMIDGKEGWHSTQQKRGGNGLLHSNSNDGGEDGREAAMVASNRGGKRPQWRRERSGRRWMATMAKTDEEREQGRWAVLVVFGDGGQQWWADNENGKRENWGGSERSTSVGERKGEVGGDSNRGNKENDHGNREMGIEENDDIGGKAKAVNGDERDGERGGG